MMGSPATGELVVGEGLPPVHEIPRHRLGEWLGRLALAVGPHRNGQRPGDDLGLLGQHRRGEPADPLFVHVGLVRHLSDCPSRA